jgi:hypothetical protein
MSYIIQWGHWCNIIVLNVHAPTEDKIEEIKDTFYEGLEHVFDKFPKWHMKILLENFSAKVAREDLFKPPTGNESLYETSNDNGVKNSQLCISKNLSKVWCLHIVTFIHLHGHLMGRRTNKVIIF